MLRVLTAFDRPADVSAAVLVKYNRRGKISMQFSNPQCISRRQLDLYGVTSRDLASRHPNREVRMRPGHRTNLAVPHALSDGSGGEPSDNGYEQFDSDDERVSLRHGRTKRSSVAEDSEDELEVCDMDGKVFVRTLRGHFPIRWNAFCIVCDSDDYDVSDVPPTEVVGAAGTTTNDYDESDVPPTGIERIRKSI